MKLVATLSTLFLLSGCALAPDRISTGQSHLSHPLRGVPFGGPEDSIDMTDIESEWRRGRYSVELGLGYKLRDGGFEGDDCVFYGRVAVDIWSRQ